MNTNIKITFLLFFTTVSLIAQDFQGIATYKTQRKLDIEIDSTQVGGMQDEIMAMLKKLDLIFVLVCAAYPSFISNKTTSEAKFLMAMYSAQLAPTAPAPTTVIFILIYLCITIII